MPNTACENGSMSALFETLTEQFTYASVTTVQRKYFNESKGTCSMFTSSTRNIVELC